MAKSGWFVIILSFCSLNSFQVTGPKSHCAPSQKITFKDPSAHNLIRFPPKDRTASGPLGDRARWLVTTSLHFLHTYTSTTTPGSLFIRADCAPPGKDERQECVFLLWNGRGPLREETWERKTSCQGTSGRTALGKRANLGAEDLGTGSVNPLGAPV